LARGILPAAGYQRHNEEGDLTTRCELTQLPLAECAGACCRPDLKAFQPIPEVWMRVTEPAGRPVVPSSADVADGNVHALLQVVSGRTARPDVVEMVRELCEPSAHQVRYEVDQVAQLPVRRSKGKARRRKAGRGAMKAPRYHRNVFPPLFEQLYASIEQSGSAEAGVSRPASSRPTARLDAIDTANRIDTQVDVWLNRLDVTAVRIDHGRPAGTALTESEVKLQESIGRLRHLASLGPSLKFCGRPSPVRAPVSREVTCCACHELEVDISKWWTWARVVTGWDTPAWQPANTCPLCGLRGSIRIRLEEQRATCINDACRETWDNATIGLLAEHIRRENNDTEESA
jgi:hypothetical protein